MTSTYCNDSAEEVMRRRREERVLGCLLGAALGDALGRRRPDPGSFPIFSYLYGVYLALDAERRSRRIVGRKTDVGGDFEANRIYAPHTRTRRCSGADVALW